MTPSEKLFISINATIFSFWCIAFLFALISQIIDVVIVASIIGVSAALINVTFYELKENYEYNEEVSQ